MAASERDLQLHHALLGGSTTASGQLMEEYLPELDRRLRRRHPEVRDDTMIWDAATDALFGYVQAPEKYDPTKLSLPSYLIMAANGDLLNAIQKERRRTSRLVSLDAVADDDPGRKRFQEPGVEDEIDLDRLVDDPARRAVLRRVLAEFTDPRDRRLLWLLVEGERRTEPYAAILGITHLDIEEQRRIVKRNKDRIDKRIKRAKGKLDE
jgi:RNA polymerase sigma-70 factor (ECF subfamily)